MSGLMLALFSVLVSLGASSAIARNGGSGEGNGGDRGNGGGGDRGRSGRSSGVGSGNDGGGRGTRDTKGGDHNSGSSVGARSKQSPSPDDAVNADNGNIRVKHGSGIAEEINDRGRYVMRDRSGRTIVNRAATRSDLDRLRSLIK
ncbi:hypothetical protein [Aliirhizobium smilacinae]|uniref:Glycine-rich cell wall protein n=1 Tax=Aliirhizobium smilacinae TaxID=1395944 RepID=A0A5C4XKE9_9HYPH|nr:hypothetical protein [Rhizobium smilacinae]TNM63993.1 hypothetical protein FHP24_14530 [Rhizobium smilacinae]